MTTEHTPQSVQSSGDLARTQEPAPLLHRGLAEAARLTGLGERTVWRLVNMNALPHRRCGRALLFVPDELVAWIEAGCPQEAGSADRVRAAMRKGGRR